MSRDREFGSSQYIAFQEQTIPTLPYQANFRAWACSESQAVLPGQKHLPVQTPDKERLWCECSDYPLQEQLSWHLDIVLSTATQSALPNRFAYGVPAHQHNAILREVL